VASTRRLGAVGALFPSKDPASLSVVTGVELPWLLVMQKVLRALFVNEGDLGSGVMGQLPVQRAISAGLAGVDGVEARFVSLPRMGLAARLLSREAPGLGRLDLDLQPVRWHLVQSWRARRAVDWELDAAPADVLHVSSHSISLALIETMRRIPTFLSLDATIWDWQAMAVWRPLRRYSRALLAPSLALERRALERARAVLAWTPWAQRRTQLAYPRAHVIEHNPGIDLDRFRPAVRQPRERARVLFVGGRFREKGGFDLVSAVEPFLGREVELDLVTPAPVPERPGLRVHVLSHDHPALVDLYQQADIFCLPTRADTMGWVLLEAMACATPVVATNVGGIPDLVRNDTGILVHPAKPRELRGAIHALLNDEGTRIALGEQARAVCEQRYDARRQTAELIRLMRQEVEGEARSGFAR
jgi:glycosyltransferase involved in cell wall biosynthesis